jgi:hypothetical protein
MPRMDQQQQQTKKQAKKGINGHQWQSLTDSGRVILTILHSKSTAAAAGAHSKSGVLTIMPQASQLVLCRARFCCGTAQNARVEEKPGHHPQGPRAAHAVPRTPCAMREWLEMFLVCVLLVAHGAAAFRGG